MNKEDVQEIVRRILAEEKGDQGPDGSGTLSITDAPIEWSENANHAPEVTTLGAALTRISDVAHHALFEVNEALEQVSSARGEVNGALEAMSTPETIFGVLSGYPKKTAQGESTISQDLSYISHLYEMYRTLIQLQGCIFIAPNGMVQRLEENTETREMQVVPVLDDLEYSPVALVGGVLKRYHRGEWVDVPMPTETLVSGPDAPESLPAPASPDDAVPSAPVITGMESDPAFVHFSGVVTSH